MVTVNIEEFLARIADDEEGMKVVENLLEATLAQRKAAQRFREYFGQAPKSNEPTGILKTIRVAEAPSRTPAQSLAQRAVNLVLESEKAVTTEQLAAALGATETQVRGALKRFVREGQIGKPRRGLWLRVDRSRANGVPPSVGHHS